MSSAQSTPDPGRQGNNYFGAAGAGTSAGPAPTASSPQAAVNGAPSLPSLPSLPPLHSQTQQTTAPRAAFFDPAYDDQPGASADTEGVEAGRRRAYSGTQQSAAPAPAPPPQPIDEAAVPQNGDTEMTDAGFTAVNR